MDKYPDRDPDVIYHYCSSSTFLSIIKNRKIWLTDLTLSNDNMEGLWAVRSYIQLFERDDSRGRFAAKTALENEIWKRVALGCCFSGERDLLSQWRGYASGGRGVCIGFRTDALIKQISEMDGIRLQKVDYNFHLSEELTKKIWFEFKEQIEEARECEGSIITFSKDYGTDGHKRVSQLISEFFSLKNPAFHEEDESRLVLVDYTSNISNLKYRESNSLLTPYLEISIDRSAIFSVTLGPLHPTPERDIEMLLSVYKVDALVRKSSASFTVR